MPTWTRNPFGKRKSGGPSGVALRQIKNRDGSPAKERGLLTKFLVVLTVLVATRLLWMAALRGEDSLSSSATSSQQSVAVGLTAAFNSAVALSEAAAFAAVRAAVAQNTDDDGGDDGDDGRGVALAENASGVLQVFFPQWLTFQDTPFKRWMRFNR